MPWKRTIIALTLFGTAFGYLEEAAVVSSCACCMNRRGDLFYPGLSPAQVASERVIA